MREHVDVQDDWLMNEKTVQLQAVCMGDTRILRGRT